MQIIQAPNQAKSVILISRREPDPTLASAVEAFGLQMHWAHTIAMALDLLRANGNHSLLVTEVALPDGNWRDLVEQVNGFENPTRIVLVSSAVTAELWWDALDCGIQDVLHAPLTKPLLRQVLQTNPAI